MTPNQKILNSFILFFLSSCLLLICLPFFFRVILDADAIRNALNETLSKKADLGITTGKMDVTYFPKLVITLEDIELKPTESETYHINRASIFPDLTDLMTGNFSLGEIRLDGIESSTVLKPNQSKKDAFVPQALLTKPNKLLALLPGGHKDITLFASNIRAGSFARADASIVLSAKNSKISGRVTVKSIFLDKPLQTGLLLPEKLKSCALDSLILNFSHETAEDFNYDIEARGFKAVIEDHGDPILSGSLLKAKVLSRGGVLQASLLPSVFNSPGLTVAINFLNDPVKKKISLAFSGNKVDIDKTRDISLALFSGNPINTHLFDIILAGRADGVHVNFNGTELKNLFDPKAMIITGTLKNGSVKIPKTRLIVTKILGSARVANGILHTNVKTGRLFESLLEKGKLDVDLLSPQSPFKGEFQLDADLARLPGILMDLLPGTLLAEEMAGVTQVAGTAKGVLYLNYKKKKLSVGVKAHDIKVSGRYRRLPGSVIIENGNFNLDDNEIRISHVDGWIDNHQLSNITACLRWEDKFFELDSGSGLFCLNTLFPWLVSHGVLKEALQPMTLASGEVEIDASVLSGPLLNPGEWEYDLGGSLRNMDLHIWESEPEISQVSGRFDLRKNHAELSGVNAHISNTALLSSFYDLPYIHELAFPVNLSNSTLQLKKNSASFNGTMLFQTGPELLLDLTESSGSYRLNRAVVSHGNLSRGILTHDESNGSFPFTLKGKIDTLTLEKLLNQRSPLLKQFEALTRGMRFLIQPHWSSDILLSTPSIDLRKPYGAKKIDGNAGIIDRERLMPNTVTIKTDALYLDDFEFKPFEAVLYLNKEKKWMEYGPTTLCGIHLNGLVKPTDGAIELTVNIDKTDGDLHKTLFCLMEETGIIKGDYTLEGELGATGSPDRIARNFKGTVELHSTGGRLYRMTLLSRILSAINISSLFRGKLPDLGQDGFAYKTIDIAAEVNGDIIHFNQAVINGIDMSFIFSGSLNMTKKTMDLTCLVAPFKTVDLIIEKIPILGPILNKKLISIPFKATGDIRDPAVSLLPGEAVGKGIINTMERILNAPFKLLENLR